MGLWSMNSGVLAGCTVLALVASAGGDDEVAARRARMVEAASQGVAGIPELQAALSDTNALVRRAAVRGLMDQGAPAREALSEALDIPDVVVQRAALLALTRAGGSDAIPYLTRALVSREALVRQTAVHILAGIEPRGEDVMQLLEAATTDRDSGVQRAAQSALNPFRPEGGDVVLLRHRPDMADHVERLVVTLAHPLPRDGWRFREDRGLAGHVERWFDPHLDDADWSPIGIDAHWGGGYVGVAWYRRWLELPERPDHLAVELAFDGVDESGWIWLNGVYVGGQDIGPAGWNTPFRVDVTDAVQWGEPNQITVRVMNTAGGGGIWKPVTLEALGFRR